MLRKLWDAIIDMIVKRWVYFLWGGGDWNARNKLRMINICGGETGCGKKELSCNVTMKKSDVNYDSYEPLSWLVNVQGAKDFRAFITKLSIHITPLPESLQDTGGRGDEKSARGKSDGWLQVQSRLWIHSHYDSTHETFPSSTHTSIDGEDTYNTVAEELLAFDSHMERGSYFSLMVLPLLGCSQTRAASSPRVVVQHKLNLMEKGENKFVTSFLLIIVTYICLVYMCV